MNGRTVYLSVDARKRVGAETFRGPRKTSRKKISTLSGVFHFSGQDTVSSLLPRGG